MNPFQRPQVTDELLSAYIDGDVTAEEKNLVERAVKADVNLAWRLESLQQTVNLLRSLPAVSLPRSFVLTEADVAPVKSTLPPLVSAARRTNRQRVVEPERSGFWQSFRDFLQGGNPLLRNMASAGLAVWLLLFGATILNPTRLVIPTMGHVETASVTGTNMQSPPATAAREVAIAQAAPDTSNAAAQPVNAQPANAQQSSSAQPGGVQENVPQPNDTAPTANSAELSQPAVVSQPAPADSEPQPAQSEPAVASKTMAVQNDASAAIAASPQLDSTQVQSDAPPALLAAGGPPGEDTSDPLSAAMSDTDGAMAGGTMGGGDVASADLSMPAPSESGEISAAQVPADSVVAAAPPPVADVTAADVTASQVEAPANSATSETAVAESASAQIETQPVAITAPAAAASAVLPGRAGPCCARRFRRSGRCVRRGGCVRRCSGR